MCHLWDPKLDLVIQNIVNRLNSGGKLLFMEPVLLKESGRMSLI